MDSLQALTAMYTFYQQFTVHLPLVCEEGCATCCSVNVTVTELEMRFLRQHPLFADPQVADKLDAARQQPHFVPTLTTNHLAACCLARRQPPEEKASHAPGRCPLLDENDRCRVYTHRPFACRAMLSKNRCQVDGEAIMPPFMYTVNLVFCQLIEHLDREGNSGNLLDMFFNGSQTCIANRKIPGVLVAPEEQIKLQRFIAKLTQIPVGNGRLADFFPRDIIPPTKGSKVT